tara:strand:- start:151 stop:615 length:465 start_codon:yes stop_codon:yes gene_type:complete
MSDNSLGNVNACFRSPVWERKIPFEQIVKLGRQVADNMPGHVLWAPGVMWVTVDTSESNQPIVREAGRVLIWSDYVPHDALPVLDDWATFGVVRRAVMCVGAAFSSVSASANKKGRPQLEYQGIYANLAGERCETPWFRSEIEAVAAVVVGFND